MPRSRIISIKSMVLFAVATTFIVAAIGICLGLFWFSNAAEPAVRTIRTPGDWNKFYLIFFGISCGFSCLFSMLMALLGKNAGMNKRGNWVINILITIIVGLALAAVLRIIAPNKNIAVTIVSSLMFFIQGAGIFFVASLKAPPAWDYNPFA